MTDTPSIQAMIAAEVNTILGDDFATLKQVIEALQPLLANLQATQLTSEAVEGQLTDDFTSVVDRLNALLEPRIQTIIGNQSTTHEKLGELKLELSAVTSSAAEILAKTTAILTDIAALDAADVARHQELLAAIAALKPADPVDPEPEVPVDPEPVDPEPVDPEPPVFTAVTAKVNAFTDATYWNKGTARQKPGFSIPDSAEVTAAFIVGAHIALADGQVRRINYTNTSGDNRSVYVDGPQVDPLLVGNPQFITTTQAAIHEVEYTPPAPVEPTPTEPVVVLNYEGPLVGANFAGMANNPWYNPDTKPAQSGTHYRTSAKRSNQGDYFQNFGSRGAFISRHPFALERLFRIIEGAVVLQEAYALEMIEMMDQAHAAGGKTILDMHNYCRVYQNTQFNADGSLKYPRLLRKQTTVNSVAVDCQWFPINHPGCKWTYDLLADAYRQIAQRFGSHPGLLAYGLMNEPHARTNVNGVNQDDGIDVTGLWNANAKKLVLAIREFDQNAWVTIAGNAYSTAKNCRAVNAGLYGQFNGMHRVMFELHQYPDNNGNGGGSWPRGVVHTIDPVARVNDWRDAKAWCDEQGLPLLAGEFGGPVEYEKRTTSGSDGVHEYRYEVQGMAQFLEDLHTFFDAEGVLRTQWLSGPGKDDDYANGLDKSDGTFKGNATSLLSRIGLMAVAN